MIFHLWRIYRSCVAGCQSLVPRCWCWCWSAEDKKKRGFWVSNGSFGRPAAAGPMGTTEKGRRSNVINLFGLTSGEKCFARFGKCLAEDHIRLIFSWRCLSSQGFTSWRRTRRTCSCCVLPLFWWQNVKRCGFAAARTNGRFPMTNSLDEITVRKIYGKITVSFHLKPIVDAKSAIKVLPKSSQFHGSRQPFRWAEHRDQGEAPNVAGTTLR